MTVRNGTTHSTTNGIHAAGGAIVDSVVSGLTSQGREINAVLLRLSRYTAVLEIYDPGLLLRASEVFERLQIARRERTVYAGRAVIHNLLDAGVKVICEVRLDEGGWTGAGFGPDAPAGFRLREEFDQFMAEWQKLHKVLPEFKLAVADLHSYLSDLRLWLEQTEPDARWQQPGGGAAAEPDRLRNLYELVAPKFALLFERFEQVAAGIEKDLRPAHALFAKRQLHPLVLCAPFMYRTFQKPLGYAGDYEMVNMIKGEAFRGDSAYAKVLNAFFLNTPPVVAHRNRLDYLGDLLNQEAGRTLRQGHPLRVLNLGCGPALEVQAFLKQSPFAPRAEFTLLDFNDETVRHTQRVLGQIKQERGLEAPLAVIKKSVAQLLKDHSRSGSNGSGDARFDLVYCAGLFDYIADPVCQKLVARLHELTAPGGLLAVTNVDTCNPSQGWMEYMVDWYLFHRQAPDLATFVPPGVPRDATRMVAESTGVNVFLEIRKPDHA